MKQVLQYLQDGHSTVADLPAPRVGHGGVLVKTTCSLVSAGTERMLVDFGRAGVLSKARQQPEKVRQVLDKMRSDGVLQTLDAVRSKLDQPLPLGYCNVGVVEAVGSGVHEFAVGDRVASNGPHAEVVSVPRNLCALIPDTVSDEAAAFTVIGAIGLQGVRLAQPTLGECFVVTGLGLIGLMTVQLLRAHGCRVLGVDFDESKLALARRFGAETANPAEDGDPLAIAKRFSRGRGVDGVIITAATKSNEPVTQAAQMCRKRGRIVLVGVVGLELNRGDFYEKELSFQVSCSYGPGRYDPAYEERGQDYPVGFVRWTEQRNFEAVLDMMADGCLDVEPLISHRFTLDDAPEAYELLSTGSEPYLGILLKYTGDADVQQRTVKLCDAQSAQENGVVSTASKTAEAVLGVIGAGNYAGRVLIPAFRAAGVSLHSLANSGGVNGAHYARKFGFQEVTTDVGAMIGDDRLNAVVIATRHDSHARYVCQALEAGKHVFCEKPLALEQDELDKIETAWRDAVQGEQAPRLMVGFNRRFAPLTVTMKRLLSAVSEPKTFVVTVNAGAIPAEHWTQDPAVGGGRIIGEGCHFIDLLRFLTGQPIVDWSVRTVGRTADCQVTDDKASITLSFADGSLGTVHYFANGAASFPKERVEAFVAGRVLQLDNFRLLRGFDWPGFRKQRVWRQDKGQNACAQAFADAVRTGAAAPIGFDELMEVSRVAVEIGEAARG